MAKATIRMILSVLMVLAATNSVLGNTRVIEEVLGGDIVRIGETFVARLTGLEAPPRNEILGYRIYDFTKRELEGKLVKIFTWTTDNTASGIVYDENGYPFVQIYYGKGLSVSFNEVLLRKGYAKVDRKHLPDDLEHYVELENEARENGLGIWEKKEMQVVE